VWSSGETDVGSDEERSIGSTGEEVESLLGGREGKLRDVLAGDLVWLEECLGTDFGREGN
jgi:hypothetical protein